MIRPLTLAIFRLRNEKNLVSSYTRLMWVVYSGEVIGAHLTSHLPTVYCPYKSSIAAYLVLFISQPEDGQCQGPKHVVVLYVINSIYISTIIYLC